MASDVLRIGRAEMDKGLWAPGTHRQGTEYSGIRGGRLGEWAPTDGTREATVPLGSTDI